MMHRFLPENREELERRCREKVAKRSQRFSTEIPLREGIPFFPDQLTRTLKAEEAGKMVQSLAMSGPADGETMDTSELGDSAAMHGWPLPAPGRSVGSVFIPNNFISERRYSAGFEADLLRCTLVVEEVASLLQLHADQDLPLSAVGNLLQNAFKLGARNGTVVLRVYAHGERIRIEVEDNGAGLAPGAADDMFLPFTHTGANRAGRGIGPVDRPVQRESACRCRERGKPAGPGLHLYHRFACRYVRHMNGCLGPEQGVHRRESGHAL
ncbi:sensor histidine kinase [Janthinobacterium sp. ZB1P44]|uniref:sensor histidine kinase n=1 Tax=Janthinobacterium sp. ZB1P44 TaxID=3424192 RepID=UPI003F1F82B2